MINGIIKLFYSEVVKTNMKKMPNGEYYLKDEYKEIKNLTLKIDSLALNIIKLIIVMITLILAFEINTLLGIGLFLIEFLYIIYKRNLEQQILESIKHLKDNVEMTTLDVLTERGKSGINILITLLILGLITNFNWSIVISFIVVFLFTIEMTTLDVLTERGKSGINILITLLILGLITNFNWSIVISFIVVFLFTMKDIYSNIK